MRTIFAVALLALTGCASGGTLPGVIQQGQGYPPAPTSWFAQQWAPYDAEMNAGRPMILVDGRQLDNRLGEPEETMALNGIEPTSVARIKVVKAQCRRDYFGEAGQSGVILIFTKSYQGPPPLDREGEPDCGPNLGG